MHPGSSAPTQFVLSFPREGTSLAAGGWGALFPAPITMEKNIIPFEKGKRSVKEIVERFYQDLDDIEEIVVIAKDREGEWIFANSELENELEWIGSLYKFINQGIMDDEEDF